DLAVRLAPKASDRERLLILGSAGGFREDPAAVFPADSLAIRFPSDPNGQQLRGGLAALRGDYSLAIEALNRAVALDSAGSFIGGQACRACESLLEIAQVYEAWDSAAAAERTARRWMRLQPGSVSPLFFLSEAVGRQGRSAEVDAIYHAVDSLMP